MHGMDEAKMVFIGNDWSVKKIEIHNPIGYMFSNIFYELQFKKIWKKNCILCTIVSKNLVMST